MKARGRLGVFAGVLVSLAAPTLIALPVVNAAPDAVCNGITVGAVSNSINDYLNRHPEVNQALIGIDNASPGYARDAYLDYYNQHPDVANALRALRGPLSDNVGCLSGALPPQVVDALLAL